MNAGNVRNSSTPTADSSSTLRPRTRRLISVLDTDDESSLNPSTASTDRAPSPYHSRSASPIPPSHLSRPTSGYGMQRSTGVGPLSNGTLGKQRRGGNESPNSLATLWGSSWNALQGIATDLLASDTSMGDAGGIKAPRVRKPYGKSHSARSSTSVPPTSWGPAISTSNPTTKDIGIGTREGQVAAFRAQKRRDMLTLQESSYADALGNFKRRMSDDRVSASAPPGDNQERDALAYVHHVQKSDTLAGITIRYNCSVNTLRKANRMWPNDAVQTRETIILPVDACSIKGKVVPGPEAVDLLGSESEALMAGQAEEVVPVQSHNLNGLDGQGRDRSNSATTNSSLRATSSRGASSLDTEPPWHHDSWVLLPGATKPTQIARLSRRSLGYFPPARRKSNCFSDIDSPRGSVDLGRPPTNDSLGHRTLSPKRNDSPRRQTRTRRLSSADQGYFPTYMTGPGGVGTMGRNVHFPGPAQDGLNKMFAKHLPDVAPPRSQQGLLTPEMPLYTDDPTTTTGSGITTPTFGKALNLENVGGAIETWMRRMATKAKEPKARRQAARVSVGVPSRGMGGIGDLIEMTDEFELCGDEDEEDGRGRQGSEGHIGSSSTATAYASSGVRERMPRADSSMADKGRKGA